MKRLLLLLLFGATAMNVATAQSLYVQSLQGALFAQPAFDSAKVIDVRRGDVLTPVQLKGAWYEVKFAGKQGWMPTLLVSERPPLKTVTVFTGNDLGLEQKARIRASNVTTAGAARGLSSDRRRVTDTRGANYSAVDRMDALKISDSEGLKFIEQGMRP